MALESETESPSTSTIDPFEANNNNVTSFDDALPENMTEIRVNDTLKDSELLKLDLNKTTEAELTAAFCQEIGSISSRYEVRQNL